MEATPLVLDAISPAIAASTAPFASVYVTLTKREHIQLLMDARYWRSLHERAVSRQLQQEASDKRFVLELQEHAGLRELALRVELALAQVQAEQRETALRGELDLAQAKVRDLQQRLFGRKSERSKGASELQPRPGCRPARRGPRRGAPGHGRKMLAHLPERIETVGVDAGNRAPTDIRAFLPWAMTAPELAAMRACRVATIPTIEGLDTS